MDELAASAKSPGKVYFTGGATALMLGFREQTIDIDLKLDPEPQGVFEAIAKLKNTLDVNVELASPADFIPAPANWREQSKFVGKIGPIEFFHFDLTLQALSKIERGHEQDLSDVKRLLDGGWITPDQIRRVLKEIEPQLLRYPAINPAQFVAKVDKFLASGAQVSEPARRKKENT